MFVKKRRKKGRKRLTPKRSKKDFIKAAKLFTQLPKPSFKMSQVIIDYGGELLLTADTNSKRKRLVAFLIWCWNVALLKKEKREEKIKEAVASIGDKEIEKEIRAFINRKLAYFKEYNFKIIDFHTKFQNEIMKLNVSYKLV